MKTYLPSIERRILVRPNTTFGILNYDIDNAYPQRVLELVRQSPTAKNCWGKRAKYLLGNGFAEPDLGKIPVNDDGLTLAKLLKAVTVDKGLFPGFGIHVNYNANYKKVSAYFVKYEDIRQGDTEQTKYKGKYIIYKDWGRRTWKNISSAKLQIVHPYNPDPEVIKAQVIEAGGWEHYNGQLFYSTPAIDDYTLCNFDASLEDIETEAGIKVFNNREVTTGFLPSTILFMKSRRETADEVDEETTGTVDEFDNTYTPSALERNLGSFQGAANAQKILVVEYDGDQEDKPEFNAYPVQNNDKLFEVTEKSVEARIIKSFEVPKELVSSSDKSGLNASGAEKREAIREFNDNTSGERMEISEAFANIFASGTWDRVINPSDNWEITEVTSEGSGPDIVSAGATIQAIIESRVMLKIHKVATLVIIHGFKEEEALRMVPDDETVKNALPSLTKTDKTIEPEPAETKD